MLRLTTSTLLTAMFIAAPVSAGWKDWVNQCATALKSGPGATLVPFEDFVQADGVPVTGADTYPTSLILKNFELDPSALSRMKGFKVLSVGEGFSGLVPQLRKLGIHAFGLDIWYGHKNYPMNSTGLKMRDYVRANKPFLIKGNARSIPIKDQSYDFVLSHMLVNNIDRTPNAEFLKEVRRILKPGGRALIFGYGEEQLKSLSANLHEILSPDFLTSLEAKAFTYQSDGYQHSGAAYLLKITGPALVHQ